MHIYNTTGKTNNATNFDVPPSMDLECTISLIQGNLSFVNSTTIHSDHRDVIINSLGGSSYEIVIGNDGGVAIGTPNTATNYSYTNINGEGDIGSRLILSQCTDISSLNRVTLGGAIDNASYYVNNEAMNAQWENFGGGDGGQTAIHDTYNLVFIRINQYLNIYSHNPINGPFAGMTFPGINPFGNVDRFQDFAEIKVHHDDSDLFYIAKLRRLKQYEINSNGNILSTPIDFDFTTDLTGTPLTQGNPPPSISCFESAPSNPNKMLLAFKRGTWYGGRDADPTATPPITAIAAGWQPRLFKSSNGGVSWDEVQSFTINGKDPIGSHYITDICYDSNNEDLVWASISGWANYHWDQGTYYPRVIHSIDGGDTWQDYSTGLSDVPVNAIIYQEGSDGVLFAATDVGVYRYNPTPGVEQWECFNEGLPVSLVSDLEINYCEGKLYASAFGRGIWESSLPDFNNSIREEVSGTWEDENTIISNTLVIKTGTQLEMKNSNYRIGEGKSIIVEPGALLILNNTTLTSICGMWDGIIVQGDATASQYGYFPNCAQGMVKIENGSVIEHANDAVRLWDPIDGGGITKAGGIINASNSTFRNNRRDVQFMKYQNMTYIPGHGTVQLKSKSTFRNCDFILDNNFKRETLNANNSLDDRVTIWDYDGIWFAGCRFRNDNGVLQNNYEVAGIYSVDAAYSVEEYCTVLNYGLGCAYANQIRSEFHNLYYGVHATGASGNDIVKVRNSDFISNVYGVATQGMNNTEITKCTFDIGSGIGHDWNYGISVNTGIGFKIQENHFEQITNPQNNNTSTTIGLYIQETGDTENKIQNNTYGNLNYANVANGNNRNTAQSQFHSGLQFLCSNYNIDATVTDIDYDIFVWGIPILSQGVLGIRGIQGVTDPSAPRGDGNRFSSNVATDGNYYIGGFPSSSVTLPILRAWKPIQSGSTYAANHTANKVFHQSVNNEDCTSELNNDGTIYIGVGGIAGKSAVIGTFETHENDFVTTAYLYNNLIDGGNSTSMSNNIQFNWSADAWTLRDELIAESPNLSQEVLLDAAYTGVLPDALLMEVLLANPNSVNDEEFLYVLENEIPNTLPISLTDLLRTIQESASLRTDLEHKMSYHNYEKTKAGHLLISNILNDSIPNRDSLNYWLDRMNTLHTKYALAESYLVSGQANQGQALLNGLNTQYTYAERFDADYQAYVQMYALKAQIYQSNRTWLDITEGEKSQLQSIAYATNADAAVQARNILCFFFDECMPANGGMPNGTTQGKVIKIQNPKLELTKQLSKVQVYPNPATDYVTFDYRLPEYLESTQLSVIDATGKVIHTMNLTGYEGQYLWDTRPIKNGMYFYVLKDDNGEIIISGKLAIAK